MNRLVAHESRTFCYFDIFFEIDVLATYMYTLFYKIPVKASETIPGILGRGRPLFGSKNFLSHSNIREGHLDCYFNLKLIYKKPHSLLHFEV